MSVIYRKYPWFDDEVYDDSGVFQDRFEGRSGLSCVALNTLSGLTSTSQRLTFEVENTQDEHPKRVTKSASGVYEVTYKATAAEGTNTICVFNTNATSAVITIEDFNDVEWFEGNEWFDGDSWWPREITPVPSTITLNEGRNSIVVKFEEPLATNQRVSIKLSGPTGASIESGIVWGGVMTTINNPLVGLREGQTDFSIEKVLSNGGFFYKKRDIGRTFSGKVYERDLKFVDTMLLDVSRKYGKKSMPWFITDQCGSRWVIFGRLSTLMSNEFSSNSHNIMNISLVEVL